MLEQDLNENKSHKINYEICKDKLNEIYDDISNGIMLQWQWHISNGIKCNWYEYGEISSKFFLNLEKYRAVQNTMKKKFS